MPRYDHRQPAHSIWLAMGVATAFIAIVVVTLSFAAPAEERAEIWWILLGVAALMALLAWLFGSLRVLVEDDEIAIRFGPGWPRKSIALADVRGAEPVRNSWWYGWGIRLTPHGWMWNVSGLDAVEVELASGRRTRIGTDEPQELAAAIRQAIGA